MSQPAEYPRLPYTPTGDTLYDQLIDAFGDPDIQQAIQDRTKEIRRGQVQSNGFLPTIPEAFVPHVEEGRNRKDQIKGIINEYGIEAYIHMFLEELRNF